MPSPGLSLLTLNIGNPSVARAKRQLAWLIMRDEQVLVLTETKASAGCRLLADSLTDAGYAVHWPGHGPGEYGTMIVATVPVTPDDGFGARVGYLPARAAAVTLAAPDGPLRVIGLYVPARDASIGKTERKRKWLTACDAALAATVTEMPAIGSATATGTTTPSAAGRWPAASPPATTFTSPASMACRITPPSRCT